jgi:hypothetical protein
VPRKHLVEQCINQLIDDPQEGGHYFTIWAPRQTGKTWLMRQALQEIPRRYGEQFALFNFSLGRLRGMNEITLAEPAARGFSDDLGELLESVLPGHPHVTGWKDFYELFSRENGLWDRPLILMIDEFDTIPSSFISLVVAQFRELYLNRETNWLHSLALIGVRAVLGVDSRSGSPFNIQKSLHVPNLTREEVIDLYQQYQEESGQQIEPEVVAEVFRMTNGQPGLVSWFGELLTERYNPDKSAPLTRAAWNTVWRKARFTEPNNTVMNLISKARDPEYQPFLVELFTHSDIPFVFHDPIQNYLYLNGILCSDTVMTAKGEEEICRFTSPFIQECLYDAFSRDLFEDRTQLLPLDPLDDLADVFAGESLNLPALLQRYKDYLTRLKAKGLNPWKEQPRRKTDFHLTEAVGHFHLYAWLQSAVGRRCVCSPEFPIGNGKVDIHLKCDNKRGVIEVKSFMDAYQLQVDREQAAQYAKSLGLNSVTMAVFIPVEDDSVLEKLSGDATIQTIHGHVVAIGWA